MSRDNTGLQRSVETHTLPDFLNATVVERGIKLHSPLVTDPINFSIEKSTAFGLHEGEAFDEGATWLPLKDVHFTMGSNAVSSFHATYEKGPTAVYGKIRDGGNLKITLDNDSGEYITRVAGTYTDKVTSLQITTSKSVYQSGVESGEPFTFEVPADHHVVGFHGYADDHIRALGVSHSRRLASIGPAVTSFTSGTQPSLQPIYSNLCLDDATRAQWAANNMVAIQQKRNQAKSDLQPIYTNISNNGERAWVLVESAGQQYYVSYTSGSTMWVYVQEKPTQPSETANTNLPTTKTCTISLGSYSKTSNLLGISGYIWNGVPASTPSGSIALAFVKFMQGLVDNGVTWGIEYAATQLAAAISGAGLPDLAKLVPQSVMKLGGVVVTGVLAVALVFSALAFASVVVKEYLLTVNVFNFDSSSTWKSLGWYGDNAELVNGQWENQSLAPFASADIGLMPPGFNPPTRQNYAVNYMSTVIRNQSKFLQGLGAGMILSDETQGRISISPCRSLWAGVAIKYVVHRVSSNAIAVKGVPGNPTSFSLPEFYNAADSWIAASTTSTQQGALTITGYTPFLNGAPDNEYEYLVNIGLPSV